MHIRPIILFRQSLRSPVLIHARFRQRQWLTEFSRDIPREVVEVLRRGDVRERVASISGSAILPEEQIRRIIEIILDRKKTSFVTALAFVFIVRKTAEHASSRLRDARAAAGALAGMRDDPRLAVFYKTSLYYLVGCDLEDEYDDAVIKDARAAEFLIAAEIMYRLFWLKAEAFRPEVIREVRTGEAVVRRGQMQDKAFASDLKNNLFDAFREGWLRDDHSGTCYDKIGAIGEHVARAAFVHFRENARIRHEDEAALSAVSRFAGLVSLALQIGEDDIREIHDDLRTGAPNTLIWFHLRSRTGLNGIDISDMTRRARRCAWDLLDEALGIVHRSGVANKHDYDSVIAVSKEIVKSSQPAGKGSRG